MSGHVWARVCYVTVRRSLCLPFRRGLGSTVHFGVSYLWRGVSTPHKPEQFGARSQGSKAESLRAGVKPDLAHVGGTGSPQSPLGHGLFSILPDGSVTDGCGTSYAAPLVAKTAAVLEHSIEGTVSRETLIGLLLHHAQMPALLQSKALRGIARDLVGFGKPPSAAQILEGNDHQITLVFASRLRKDQQIGSTLLGPPPWSGQMEHAADRLDSR